MNEYEHDKELSSILSEHTDEAVNESSVKKRKKTTVIINSDVATRKKAFIIAGIAIVLVLAIIFTAAFLRLRTTEDNSPLLYIKENTVMVKQPKVDHPTVLSNSYYATEDDTPISELLFMLNEKGNFALYSESVETISETPTYSLYYRDILNATSTIDAADAAKGLFLSNNVFGVPKANAGFSVFAYLRSPTAFGGQLKVHNLENEISIDNDVADFYISANGKELLYTKLVGTTYEIYRCKVEKNPVPKKVAEKLSHLYVLDTVNLKNYVFATTKDDGNMDLFLVYNRNAPESLAENVSSVSHTTRLDTKNDLYYVLHEKKVITLNSIIDDPNKDTPINAIEPVREGFASNEEYDIAVKEYKSLLAQIEWRKKLAEGNIDYTTSEKSLYHMNAKKAEKVSSIDRIEKLFDDAITYTTIPEGTKITLQELIDLEFSIEQKDVNLFENAKKELVFANNPKETVTVTEVASAMKVLDYIDGTLYVAENCDKELTKGDIVAYNIRKKSEKVRIDSGIFLNTFTHTSKGSMYYLKDMKEATGTLYWHNNKKAEQIATGVHSIVLAGNESVFFYTDFDHLSSNGTLNYAHKSSVRVADSIVRVGSENYRSNENLFYIKSFDSKIGEGSLYLKEGKKSPVLISEYVSQIAK